MSNPASIHGSTERALKGIPESRPRRSRSGFNSRLNRESTERFDGFTTTSALTRASIHGSTERALKVTNTVGDPTV